MTEKSTPQDESVSKDNVVKLPTYDDGTINMDQAMMNIKKSPSKKETSEKDDQQPAPQLLPGEDVVVRDIKNRTAATYVTEQLFEPLKRIHELLKGLDERSPIAFRKCVADALQFTTRHMEAVIEGFRRIEKEDVNILLKLHRAYLGVLGQLEYSLKNLINAKYAEVQMAVQKMMMLNGVRLNEILRLEHTVMTMFHAMCERGVFDQDEKEKLTEGEAMEREEKFIRSRENYLKMSKRLLATRLGIEPFRDPMGGTVLTGGNWVQVFNITDEDPVMHISGGNDAGN